ncbi:MAG: putative FAD-binding dehydrogenase [Syntrophorhabdus sp. PtaU1.Bin058]|nr:MAG: putative FAD-binding dehydrogenase [Syntrophorhabdus sp. PtaU1.Bin058]
MKTLRFFKEKARDIPVLHEVDVLVGGGGTAGFTAALSAARLGAKVMIVEKYGFLGGMCTAGYVTLLPIWNLTPWKDEKGSLIGGIAEEIVDRLDEMGGSVKASVAARRQAKNPVLPYWPTWFQFDFEAMKILMQEMLQEVGVRMLLHTYIAGTIRDGDKVKGLIVENKSGRQAIMSNLTIDCTGDGDVSFFAGASFEKEPAKTIMPVTLPFYMGNVDSEKAVGYLEKDPGLKRLLDKKGDEIVGEKQVLKASVKLALSRVSLPPGQQREKKYAQFDRNGEWYVWGAHSSGKDVTDAYDLTDAEIETRRKVWKIANFLKRNVPGFEDSYVVTTAAQVGIRESRRIVGGYVLTRDDVLKGNHFQDAILRSRTGEWELQPQESPPPFDIPFRCIIPEKLDNLLVAGRCISMEHEAATFFSPRDITTCMGLGEVAGAAAVLSLEEKKIPREIDVTKLQKVLKGNNKRRNR